MPAHQPAPTMTDVVCPCCNIRVRGSGEVHREQVTVRYPELSLWKSDHPPVARRRRESFSASRSRSPRKAGVGEDGEGTLVCLACREEVVRSSGDKVVVVLQPRSEDVPESAVLGLHIKSTASTFGAPSRPSTPDPPASYLPPSPDPFFLPPPFTPAHPFFHTLARRAASYITDSRAQVEREIREFVRGKRGQVDRVEREVRGEVEYLWEAFEAGQRERGEEAEAEVGVARVGSFRPARGSFTGMTRPDVPSPPAATFGGAGSLLGASLSTHGFFPQHRTEREPAPPVVSPTSPRPAAANHVHKPTFEQNSITMPYQQRKSGIDLDVAASLRVSNMSDLYTQPPAGSTHNRPDTHDRRYFDPGADVEDVAVVPGRAERSPSLGKREKIERAGGKGDIELQPFAESSQVSAASSYQASHEDGWGKGGPASGEEEQLRTPRGRAVKPIGESISPAQLNIPDKGRKGSDSVSPAVTVKSLDKQPGNGARAVSDGQVPTRKKVTFEEPTEKQAPVQVLPAETHDEDGLPSEPEDAVFDFEEHDTPIDIPEPGLGSQQPRPLAGSTPDADKVEAMRRNTELVENKLIDMVAADAPSHRAAWRNNKDQLWQALGRYQSRPFGNAAKRERADARNESDDDASWGTSLLGTSAPIQIQRPAQSATNYALEPKTSLVERPGVMVPPLRTAMRTSSSTSLRRQSSGSRPPPANHDLPADVVAEDAHNLPGSNTSSDIRRRASTGHAAGDLSDSPATLSSNSGYSLSEKRTSFAMDPGPALEMDDDDDADDVPGGINFVPPHRQLSQERDPDGMGEAGWRSLA